jgi:hypothetical protein
MEICWKEKHVEDTQQQRQDNARNPQQQRSKVELAVVVASL